jgi:hypothetical protein
MPKALPGFNPSTTHTYRTINKSMPEHILNQDYRGRGQHSRELEDIRHGFSELNP